MTTLTESMPSLGHPDVFGRSWAGRWVTVVGLGRSGIAAARLLLSVGCRVRVTDARDSEELRSARDALLAAGVEEVELGGHTQDCLQGAEVVVVSPGVPETAAPIQWAMEQRLAVISEIELAFLFCPSPVIAVTGTNGKSTAVTLITEVLSVGGRSAIACGNLGTPFSSVISRLTPSSIAVVEVSSFQLVGCDQFRPAIGVLLNIGTNHLDRHADQQAYIAAKARIFRRQTPTDWAVLNGSDTRIVAISERCHAQHVWFGENRSNPLSMRLAPETRQALTESAQAVLQVGRLFGIPDPLAAQAIRSFRGLEHRLERVTTTPRGVHMVNDSKSTTPDSLRFALAEIPGDVVVIIGGRDKGLDFSQLVEPLHAKRVKGIVLIGESRSGLRRILNGAVQAPPMHESDTLEEAVRIADGLARPGTTLLFSPACASFDMFRDFEDRGRAFKEIVAQVTSANKIGGSATRCGGVHGAR